MNQARTVKTQLAAALVALVCICCNKRIYAEDAWVVTGSPIIIAMTVQTVGGITYFTHTSRLQGCKRVSVGPVNYSGSNLFQIVNEETWNGFCVCDAQECDPFDETHVSVLGNLPTGDYRLRLYSSLQYPSSPFVNTLFEVPVSNAPTIEPAILTNNFVISIAGISNVLYSVEVSTNLANWMSVHTNNGAPFTWSEPISSNSLQRFYRVRIEGI
jgi:hypothetical protein